VGLLQFGRAFRRGLGLLHGLSGRIFVVSGVVMGLSGLRLVAAFHDPGFNLTDASRLIFGPLLVVALGLAVVAIRNGDVTRHRAWMVRAYAIGMGTAPIGFVFFPLFLSTGVPPEGLTVDLVFVGTWITSIAVAEAVIRLKLTRPAPAQATGAATA